MLLPELGPPAAAGDRATLFEAIRQALAAIAARRPTVLFLDDLQWADDATPELLGALARSLDLEPLLVLGAFRSDELPRGHSVRGLRSELRRASRLRQITVEPFDAEASAALLEQTLGTVAPSLRRAVFDHTDGVPFFVRELGSASPPAAAWCPARPAWNWWRAKMSRFQTASVTPCCCVRQACPATLATPSRLRQLQARRSILSWSLRLPDCPSGRRRSYAVASTESESEPGQMAFRHALVRDAFYGDIPWTRRVAVHQAVAQRLEAGHAASVLVAEHWVLGRRPEQARAALSERPRRPAPYTPIGMPGGSPAGPWSCGRMETMKPSASTYWNAWRGMPNSLATSADAVPIWREVADGHRRDNDLLRLGMAQRRVAAVLELQGRWQEALSSREQAALAFTAAGSPADAAAERIASAAHLRSAGSFRAANQLAADRRGAGA